MLKSLLALVLIMGLTACAGEKGQMGNQGNNGQPGPVTVVPSQPAQQSDVDKLIADENQYRNGLGQTMLSNGLSCTLYTITGGERIQASIAGHNTLTGISQVATFLFQSQFNQPDSNVNQTLNVLPQPLRSLYTNLYLLRCQGQIVVTDTNYYSFELTSDDGSVLYIDGVKTIDNDNNHGATLVSGMKYLRRGVHTIRLDYSQAGGGNQALILTFGSQQIDPKYLFH